MSANSSELPVPSGDFSNNTEVTDEEDQSADINAYEALSRPDLSMDEATVIFKRYAEKAFNNVLPLLADRYKDVDHDQLRDQVQQLVREGQRTRQTNIDSWMIEELTGGRSLLKTDFRQNLDVFLDLSGGLEAMAHPDDPKFSPENGFKMAQDRLGRVLSERLDREGDPFWS